MSAFPMRDMLSGFSRGLFSNWLWHRPLHLVVDAGEGLQLGLGSAVLQPSHVLVTHGHSDHILGLPGFISARRFRLGDPERPLTVVYPEGAAGVQAMRDLLGELWPEERFPVTWLPLRAGGEVSLGKGRLLDAFAADHQTDAAIGYRVMDVRRRLRREYRDLPQQKLRQLAAEGRRDEVMEEYRHILLAHTGDTMPLDPLLFRGADLLVHDATFLEAADRREPAHATTEEAIVSGREAGVARLLLQHLSVRYERPAALVRLRAQVRELGFAGECWLLDGAELARLDGGDGSVRGELPAR